MDIDSAIAAAVRTSRFAARTLARAGQRDQLAADLGVAWHADALALALHAELARVGPQADATRPLAIALRRIRTRLMLALIAQDVSRQIGLDEVVRAMSDFADLALNQAHAAHWQPMVEAHGAPLAEGVASPLIIIGMGKLGGRELNVSSDIDLVFAYAADGQTGGPRPLSHHEFYARLGQRIIDTLARVSDEGFVFRVDMRLRPFGDAGPLVTSFASLATYFVSHGRAWERYAWAKSRPITGDAVALGELMGAVTPFVYRRYADYGLTESLRDLSQRIRAQHGHAKDDIKLRAGGIRECEFVLQSLQLIHGGRNVSLQTASTRELAARLVAARLLTPERSAALLEGYRLLRNVEHRIQYLDDQHTQTLPSSATDRDLIAQSLGMPDSTALAAAMTAVEQVIATEFAEGIAAPASAEDAVMALARLFATGAEPMPAEAFARALADPAANEADRTRQAAIADNLAQHAASNRWQRLPERTQTRLARFLAELVRQAMWLTEGEATTRRAIALIDAVARREAYVALLAENPALARPLAHLLARSAWLSRTLVQHPLLLDELARAPSESYLTDWPGERAKLAAALADAAEDEERCLNLLRDFKLVHEFKLAVAALEADLQVMPLADELAALADTVIEATLKHVATRLSATSLLSHFAVIGYGKLGGKELGFSSDLDLIFLYADDCDATSESLARLAQRVVNALSVNTTSGRLYEVDLRLRPDGASGMLVSSVAAFAAYQADRAWFWEHQALSRARFVAGSPHVGALFETVRRDILSQPRVTADVAQAVKAMRQKMRDELKGRDYDGDVKHIDGGMVDLEFTVQALILTHAHAHPQLLANTGNRALLAAAGKAGLLPAPIALDAGFAYLALRDYQTTRALDLQSAKLTSPEQFARERRHIRDAWDAVIERAASVTA